MQELELSEPSKSDLRSMAETSEFDPWEESVDTHLYLTHDHNLVRGYRFDLLPIVEEDSISTDLELIAVFENNSLVEDGPVFDYPREKRELESELKSGDIDFREYIEEAHRIETSPEAIDVMESDAKLEGLEGYDSLISNVEDYLNERDDYITKGVELKDHFVHEQPEMAYDMLQDSLGFRVNFLYGADQEVVDEYWHEMSPVDYSDEERHGLPGRAFFGNTREGPAMHVFYEGEDELSFERPSIEEEMIEKAGWTTRPPG